MKQVTQKGNMHIFSYTMHSTWLGNTIDQTNFLSRWSSDGGQSSVRYLTLPGGMMALVERAPHPLLSMAALSMAAMAALTI